MITRGTVRGVRELSGKVGPRVQAEVCLGASAQLGTAVAKVELQSEKVLNALAALKDAIAEEALELTKSVLKDQLEWDRAKAAKASGMGVP